MGCTILDARNVALKWHTVETLPSAQNLEQEQQEYEALIAPVRATLEKVDKYVRDTFQDDSATLRNLDLM